MVAEYPLHTIGEVCYVTDGAHARVERREHGVPYLTSKNIGHGRLLLDNLDFISEEDFERLFANTSRAQRRPSPGDVLIGIIGTFGNAYLYKDTDKFGISSAVALLRPDPSKVYPGFLYFAVTSTLFQNVHSAFKSGSVQGYTNIPTVKCLPIPVPPIGEQRAIAHILGTLDDKIELNQQMNKTLQAIGQAIFKHWFVDFEFPNEEGEPYKSSGGKTKDSELGEIPTEWDIRTAGDVMELAYGEALRDDVRRHGTIPVFGSNGQIGWHDKKLVDGPGIIVGRKGNPGIVKWSQTAFFPIDTTFYVVPKHLIRSMHYLFYALQFQNLHSLAADSAVPGLNRNIVYTNKLLVPSPKILEAFDSRIRILYAKVHVNDEQSRVLTEIRDSLLPKLMSGKVRVPVEAR